MAETFINLSTRDDGIHQLLLRGPWTPDSRDAVAAGNYELLRLYALDWSDYSPLQDCSSHVHRMSVPYGPDSTAGIDALSNLEQLELGEIPEPAIDFRLFPKLNKLKFGWGKGMKMQFLQSPSLEQLEIHRFKGTDLETLAGLNRLETLTFVVGRVRTLAGAGSLRKLRHVTLDRTSELTDLSALVGLDIQTLTLTGRNKVQSIECVERLSSLESLYLDVPKLRCGNLAWVAQLPLLQSLTLTSPIDHLEWKTFAQHPNLRQVVLQQIEESPPSESEIRQFFGSCHRSVKEISFTKPGSGYGVAVEISRDLGA